MYRAEAHEKSFRAIFIFDEDHNDESFGIDTSTISASEVEITASEDMIAWSKETGITDYEFVLEKADAFSLYVYIDFRDSADAVMYKLMWSSK